MNISFIKDIIDSQITEYENNTPPEVDKIIALERLKETIKEFIKTYEQINQRTKSTKEK